VSELWAVEGMTIDHSEGSAVSGGTFTVTPLLNPKVNVDGNGVYFGPIAFTFAGGLYNDTYAATGAGIFTGTSLKATDSGLKVLRLGDTADLVGGYIVPPNPVPVSFTSKVEITDAGQEKVSSD